MQKGLTPVVFAPLFGILAVETDRDAFQSAGGSTAGQ